MIEIFVMMMIIVSMIIEMVIKILLITAQYHDYHD